MRRAGVLRPVPEEVLRPVAGRSTTAPLALPFLARLLEWGLLSLLSGFRTPPGVLALECCLRSGIRFFAMGYRVSGRNAS